MILNKYLLLKEIINMENIESILEKSILRIFDSNGNEIPFNTKKVCYYKNKYSSSKNESLSLFIDNVQLSGNKKNKRKVEYICTCGSIHTMDLGKFLCKKKMTCVNCRETEEKREWHKLYFKKKKEGLERGYKNKREKKKYSFEEEDDEFKNIFYKKHLTLEEFNNIKKYIFSIHDIEIENKNVIFLPNEPVFNQKKYRQCVKIDGNIYPFTDVYLKCPLCGEIFHISRLIKERVIKNNFNCRTCFLNNKTFTLKRINEFLTYQSNTELKFIEKCFKNNISIIDGRKIPYYFNNKKHVYNIDFELPDLKFLIEIKDNHIWHKQQISSGKWGCKEESAIKYCEKNQLKYRILFPNEIDTFFKHIKEIV